MLISLDDRTRRLAAFSAALAIVAPLVMVLANRSAPLVVGISGLLAIAALWMSGWRPAPLDRIQRVALLLLVIALVWLGWRADPADYGEALISAVAGVLVALALPALAPRWFWPVALGAVVAACGLIALELATGQSARMALGLRHASYIFNRPVVMLCLLVWPLAWWAGRRFGPAGAAAVFAVILATALSSESQAAVFGLAIGVLAWLAGRIAPRAACYLAGACVVLVLAVSTVIGPLAQRALPDSFHAGMSDSNSKARVDIWVSFGEAIRTAPLIGQGFGTSDDFASMAVAEHVAPEHRVLLAVGHPHNAALQIWAETGLVGVLLTCLGLLATIRVILRTPRRSIPVRLGCLATICSIALVGHGAWQGWWLASIGLAIAWLRIADRHPELR